jgi:hypothetical protein
VNLAEDFYRNATECLERSREAKTVEAQAEWLSMADFWYQLAQQTEQRNGDHPAESDIGVAAQPLTNDPDRGA